MLCVGYVLAANNLGEKISAAQRTASIISDEDVEFCKRIGDHGLELVRDIQARKGGGVVNVLTHCNAGFSRPPYFR